MIREELRLKMINVGCGRRTHPSWINLDLAPGASGVLVHDIRKGIPFATGALDVVYHSHVLEHLIRSEASALILECSRVLKPGGILRVVVPDLESIASHYLAALNDARAGVPGAEERHDWMVLELVDQLTRHASGGELLDFISSTTERGRSFALQRFGSEVEEMCGDGRRTAPAPSRLVAALRAWRSRGLLPSLLGPRWRIGDFRLSGEVHRYMYDVFSVSRLLNTAGFRDVRVLSATSSAIPGWSSFLLDADASGHAHKPDSLYVEAVKPSLTP